MGDISDEKFAKAAERVIIIGAGATGLCIAHGLRKAGIPVVLYDKSPAVYSPGERDWNMGLHWALPVLKKLIPEDAVTHLQSVQVDPNTLTKPMDQLCFLNGLTGDLISAMDVAYFLRLRRSKLRAMLAKDLDIRWNKRISEIVHEHDGRSVTAIFDDGEHVSGRLLIGADGARSTVRSILLGPKLSPPNRLPYSATFVQAKYTREQAIFLRSFHPLYIACIHPVGRFGFFGLQDAPEVDKPEDWTFFFYISWNSSLEQQDEERKTFGARERLVQVKEKSITFCEPWKSAFEWVSEDQPAWYFDLATWDPSESQHKWDNKNGRVTLAGDAAHPMTFQRGQGLNHSVTDAGKLVECLTDKESSHVAAVDKYEAEMMARAGEEVRLSVMNTTMLHDWSKVLESPLMKYNMNKS